MTRQEKRPGGEAGPKRHQRIQAWLSTPDYTAQKPPRQQLNSHAQGGG